jgi:hypothetical protein
MRTIRVFLSSSSDLADDRKEFEIFINRENKSLIGKKVFFELVVWEDFIDSMSRGRLQDEYNEAIRKCDIFVMLVFTKVGKYIEEEFEVAFGQFKATSKPLIFTYFKDAEISTASVDKKDLMRLWAFQDKLGALGHFFSVYKTTDDLKLAFNNQLAKLLPRYLEENQDNEFVNYIRRKVFISYSHRDQPFFERLLVHLKPLCTEGLIEEWDDTQLRPGDDWKIEIDRNLRDAGFAILLVSADFLASDFIVRNELPPLLEAAEKRGTRITPIIVKPCRFDRHKQLSIYQAVNSPTRPLSDENESNQEKIYDKVAQWIEVYMTSDIKPNA